MPKKDKKKPEVSAKGRKNHKAFNVANIVRTKRTQQRNLDRAQKKELIPLINRDEELPPPALVVVMGPKGVGKSTLIRSLAKIYTGQNLSDTVGPITVVAGRKRRVTFFECPLDLLSMTDLSKTADLVLLMIDASYGFEMETFEFLNQLQLHGFPKVMGVLTHLDKFKANKTLQSTKKSLKHRFWTEIYKGAKMFEFMGVVNNKYRKHEVKRLSMYISRVKFRPLIWRNTHPYVVADRVEDVTSVSRINEEGAECDRDVTLYGYVRGSHLKASMKIHLIGAGDFEIASISALPDPCPLPGGKGDRNEVSLKTKKDNLLYAPLANIGRVSMDKDGLYIEIKNIHYTKKEHLHLADMQQGLEHHNQFLPDGRGDIISNRNLTSGTTPLELLRSMQDVTSGVDTQLEESAQMSVFATKQHRSAGGECESGVGEEELSADELEEAEGLSSDGEAEGESSGDGGLSDEFDSDEESESEDEASDYEEEIEDDRIASSSAHNSDVNNKYFAKLPSFAESVDVPVKSGLYVSRAPIDEHGNKDWMREVYGSNWANSHSLAFESSKPETQAPVEVEDEEDDLFSFKKYDTKAASAAQQLYQANNSLDSSRSNALSGGVLQVAEQVAQLSLFGGGRDEIETEDRKENTLRSTAQSPAFSSGAHVNNVWLQNIKLRFVTGKAWATKIGEDAGDEQEGYGDFEDLQTGEVFSANGAQKGNDQEKLVRPAESDEDAMEKRNVEIDRQLRALNASKKADFKAKFDKSYDSKKMGGKDGEEDLDSPTNSDSESDKKKPRKKRSGFEDDVEDERGDDEEVDMLEEEKRYLEAAKRAQEQLRERNRSEFGEEGEMARQQHEGFRQGLYVRILLKRVAHEFTANFRAQLPVVLGGLLPHETAMGFINARVKRHRWHKRILKSNDPLIFSIGWRRFQSIPVYTMEDPNERERYLKYTPEHMHCTATFYGPLVPPNTGILAFQKITGHTAGFRISLTGTTLEQRATPSVVKKLKLVGAPTKVFKNTAFIAGMFNSALEVAKFEHAKIKTVSGIRGSIKKAMRDGGAPGTFRASFEDKILMSDIVICRLWVPVEPKKYYNPVLSLLAPLPSKAAIDQEKEAGDDTMTSRNRPTAAGDVSLGLNLMRTTKDVRVAQEVPQVINKDSLYKPIVRKVREFKKLSIPTKLQESLPFKAKPKQDRPKNRDTYAARRAVIAEPDERKSRAALQMLSTIKKSKVEKRAVANAARQSDKQKVKDRESSRFEDFHKETKKRKYMEQGKEKLQRAKKAAKRA